MQHRELVISELGVAALGLLLILLVPHPAHAGSADLSLFTSSGAGPPPNVMILFDTSISMEELSASCGSCTDPKWRMARDAVFDIVRTINPLDGSGGHIENARFGLFYFDRKNFGGRLMVPIAPGNTASLLSTLAAMTASGPTDVIMGGTPIASALTDVGRYFMGAAGWGSLPLFGTLPVHFGNGQKNPDWSTLPLEPTWPSPIDLGCRQNSVVLLSDGRADTTDMFKYVDWPAEPWGATKWCALIGDADGDGKETGCGNACDASWIMDESCAAALNHQDYTDDPPYVMFRTDFAPAIPGVQNIVVHSIAYDLSGFGRTSLIDAATNGGGTFADATDYQTIYDALLAITAVAFDGTVSFAAPTVPASRTQDDESFYYTYFKPDAAEPVWKGFLATYAFNADGDIVDKLGAVVLSSGTGLIDPNAPPIWEAGALLQANTARTLYTTIGGVRVGFDNTNVRQSDLFASPGDVTLYPNHPASGVLTLPLLRDAVVDYVQGKDAFDEDNDGNKTENRPVVLGDIFHSTPVAVGPPTTVNETKQGFGPAATPGTFLYRYGLRDRVLYAGANDGMLHAFHAGTAGDDPATVLIENDHYDHGTGQELFGYVPGSLLPTIQYIPRNVPRTHYYVDGTPAVADVWLGASHDYANPKTADEWATVLVASMREGGESYLALDVTDPAAVVAGAHGPYPKLLWEFTHANLAETWSEPILTRVKLAGPAGLGDKCGRNDGDGNCREQWVAIFAGGYRADGNPNNPTYVGDPASASWSDKGKGIFMVSLDTGAVIAKATFDVTDLSTNGLGQMKFAMPSTPAVLDIDFDGFADLVYVGDLGGQVWKWDFSKVGVDTTNDGEMDNWPAGVFFRAYAGVSWLGGVNHHHSIFFPPTATKVNGKLILAFGTGEREDLGYAGDPLSTLENNRFYVVRDDFPTGTSAFTTLTYEDSLTDITNPLVSPNAAQAGFFFMAADGEKFVSNHEIFAGKVITTSYVPIAVAAGPPPDPCSSGGSGGGGFLYIFDLVSGAGFFADAAAPTGTSRRMSIGSGLPTTPQLSLGKPAKLFVKTSTGETTIIPPPGPGTPPPSVVFWRQVF